MEGWSEGGGEREGAEDAVAVAGAEEEVREAGEEVVRDRPPPRAVRVVRERENGGAVPHAKNKLTMMGEDAVDPDAFMGDHGKASGNTKCIRNCETEKGLGTIT